MATLLDNFRSLVNHLEEAEELLFSRPTTDTIVINRWKSQCDLCLKQLRYVLKDKLLSVSEKQSIIHMISKIECFKIKLHERLTKSGGGLVQNKINARVRWIDVDSAFNNRMRTSIVANIQHIDVKNFLQDASVLFIRRIKSFFKKNDKPLKINSVLSCKFKKIVKNADGDEEGECIETKHFNTKNTEIFAASTVKQWFIDHIMEPLLTNIEEFEEQDSGWTLHSIVNIQINMNVFNPIRTGSSYIPLPEFLIKKEACINVKNSDNQCFKWAILSALHPVPSKKHPNRVTNYFPYEEELNMSGIEFPVSLKKIPKFEKQNNGISVNVFGLDEKSIVPLYLTSEKKENHVNLLLLTEVETDSLEENISHFVYIKNLSRLVSDNLARRKKKRFICDRCLNFFFNEKKLAMHEEHCKLLNDCKVKLPTEGRDYVEFKNYGFKEKVPFTMYADCECLLKPLESKDDSESNTTPMQKHEIYSIGYYFKCAYDDTLSVYRSYRGVEAAHWFAEELRIIEMSVTDLHKNVMPMTPLTSDEIISFNTATVCHICEKSFSDSNVKVQDHCHLSGKYRGAAHAGCNLNYQDSRIIPVIFHNLSGYDAHFIISDVSNHFPGQVYLLPITKEKYISFTKSVENSDIKFKFIDSFRFMPTSLEKLSSYLEEYKIVDREFSSLEKEKINLLTRKGVLPYEYITSWDKLDETTLPDLDKFFSTLNDSGISMEDYEHAQNVWRSFNIQTLGEYSDLYMKTDILLLADVFENFREHSIKAYGLDPAHYYTTPGFSWDAMLKHSGIRLKLLTDIDMVLFIERGIRGGLSQCSHRYATANNKYMLQDYKTDEETSFLIYLDANNLYGYGESQYLPYDDFEWITDCENFNFFSVADNASNGYILEVDLEYPYELHDEHNDLPFCPEHLTPPESKQKKLLATLQHKKNYVIDYRALKQVIAHGLRLSKIHRVLKFKQSPWLKSYIDLNSSMRAQAKNEFEKIFFKLMNNAVYGKTMENVRKRVNVKLLTKWDGRYGAQAYISYPNFHSSSIFNENLVAVQLRKTEVIINKPIYVGLVVLDLSKRLMYDFHYNYMRKIYKGNCKLLYTDTDSFIYAIKCDDFYEDMKSNIHRFDTSDYPADNIFNVPRVNKKIVGLMKDECNGKILTEFVGLRSKMYATRINCQYCVKKIKGIKGSVVKKSIKFDDYVDCLRNTCIKHRKQHVIRSRLHNVETIRQNKIALSPYDDKRRIQDDNIQTLAWGHYTIKEA